MEFSAENPVVQGCIRGMALEAQGDLAEARRLFLEAWNKAESDHEKFIAAHFVARTHDGNAEALSWLETALSHALRLNDDAVRPALPGLYARIADAYAARGDDAQAQTNRDAALAVPAAPTEAGPFFHGTKADLQVGDMLTPGRASNYADGLVMHHIYFTAGLHGAGLAAALAKGEGRERVYVVAPTGPFEPDPNVTNQKFPGNPTRSYRTGQPLKIVGEVADWSRQTPEQLAAWRKKLAEGTGDIIN